MKKKIVLILTLVLCFCVAAIGCSKSNGSYMRPDAEYPADVAYDFTHNSAEYAAAKPDGDNAPADQGGSNSPDDILVGRKIIRDAKLTVQALDFDAFMSGITAKLNNLGGYVQTNSVDKSGYGRLYNLRTAQMVVRVPADRLDEFLSTVDGLGNVTQKYENVNDVTDAYVDIEARLASLRTEYDTLLGLLERADSLENVIVLQDRITDVRYEIESYEARIRSYDSLIAYSTVTMSINEVERETAVEEESFGQEVKRRFNESLEDIGYGFERFAAWFLGDFPSILLFVLIFIGIPVLIAVIIIKSAKKRKEKKLEKAKLEKTANAENNE